MVMVLLVGGGMGWEAYRARKMRNAVAVIEKFGGVIEYQGRFTGGNIWVPSWLNSLSGLEYFVEVRSVNSRSAREEVFTAVAALGELERFTLNARTFSDRDLARTANSVRARTLVLFLSAGVTDAGLANLASCRSLERLDVWYGTGSPRAPGLSDAWLAKLVELPRLRALSVHGGETNAQITSLAKIEGLQELDLGVVELTDLTGTSLAALKRFPSLRRLTLEPVKLNDVTLGILRELPFTLDLWIQYPFEEDVESRLLVDVARLQNLECLTVGPLLTRRELSSEFFARLEELPNFRELSFSDRMLSERECEGISRLRGLAKLGIAYGGLDGDCVKYISSMRGLKELNCKTSYLTVSEMAQIQRALPSLKIKD
jgi:hypothetical protein